jgi:zinc transport system substrate-binding protein
MAGPRSAARGLAAFAIGLALMMALALVAAGATRAEPPRVVASILPVHSLVAGVMGDIAKPYLLLKGGASPHSTALKPSDARALQRARLVFWVGAEMERFLIRPLGRLARKARKVALMEAKGVRLPPVRVGGVWGRRGPAPAGHGERAGTHDPHIWLDPRNATAMVAAIVTALAQADPDNAAAYRANGRKLAAKLAALDRELDDTLAPVRGVPFVVFHDAYQYFEQHYRLNAVGAVTLDPGRPPGARRLSAIRAAIRERGARCVFVEPQFRPTLVRTAREGTTARAAILDPLGAAIKPGPEAYFTLMRRLAASLARCLKGDS